ncbi:MAG: hypothetical protein DRM97_04670, partial [Thermoprotei archaeon]
MPSLKVIHSYEIPPRIEVVEVKKGETLAEALYKMNIKYDAVIVAHEKEIVSDPKSFRIEKDT